MTQSFEDKATEFVRKNHDSVKRIAQYDKNELNRAIAMVFLEAANEMSI